MSDYKDMAQQLRTRLDDLLERAEVIEDDLRHPLDADSSEQAVDLADDEALEGVDEVLRAEIQQIRYALTRIENGTYGTCAKCGKDIARKRLEARPIATRCIDCASAA
ncbi:TraR/DksA family transcriptional regulator [Erythrobacter sp. JK5]|uniref:TraR/DksA family transcriptional regulator n=1 Tax=Erythrobacter sp. JK5 TaxID=2829500 RepID=UPI001BAC56DF|nr:TraR/DksA family transcriptional regulator [Erythrobacter sp. JK5]QUL39113.1 TraR/DksA family transcriptional regulator [Erythrobacter sp. JK5]